jgi:hypothetical protein
VAANFTQLSVPLARNSANFAPIKPLQKLLQDKKPASDDQASEFEKAVRRVYQARMKYEESAWNELYSMAQLVALFRTGNQLLVRRPYGVGYYVRPIANDDTYRQTAMNMMGFHSQICESKITASNPNVNMRAGDDTPQSIAAAQACRPVVDCYETEWYTSKFTRREALDLLTNGMFIHIVRWNPFKGGWSVQERQVSQVQKQSDDGYGECAECSFVGRAQDFDGEVCPECQSGAVDVKPPTMINLNQIRMGESRPVGEPELIRTPFQGWRWDLSKDLEESSWAIFRQRITQGVVNLMLGDVVIPDTDSSSDRGLEILHALAYAGQAFQGQSNQSTYGYGRNTDRQPTMCEFWVSLEDMAEIQIEESVTVSGQTIPKGRMSDFFKEPVCIVGLNDMSVVVGVYASESHKQQAITGQWIMQSDSGAGRGMEDTAAVQRRFNAVDGQIYQGLAMTATPAILTDSRFLHDDQDEYLFTPGKNVGINMSLLPPNLGLKDAFFLGNPGNVSQQYINYGTQFLRQMADISSFATEFSDVLSIDNRTATGAQISNALANSLYGPMLATKAQARVTIAKRIVELVAKHDATERYFPGKGNARGRMVSGRDLKGKVVFELVPNSELPVTSFSQQTDVRVFFESFGGAPIAAQLKKADPEFFRATAAPFNIPWGNESDDDISTLCLDRLEQMKLNLQAGVSDPKMLAQTIQPPISVIEPKHKEKADWYADFLDLKQGQESDIILREAVTEVYWLHMNYETQKQIPPSLNAGIVAAAGQAPMALGAAALQQEQAPPQEQDESTQIEADVAMSQADNENDLKLKAMESETAIAVAKQQGENQLAATKLQGENQKAVAKLKPRPVVRPAAKAS